MNYNERYVAYANYNNKTPEEMLVYDRELYPSGHGSTYGMLMKT